MKYRKLSHVVYKCDYHIVFVTKYRFRILTGEIKTLLEHDIKMLSEWKDVIVEEMIKRYVKYQEDEEKKTKMISITLNSFRVGFKINPPASQVVV